MSQEIHACVIVHPTPGKEERLKELCTELAAKTREEKSCLKFKFYEHVNPETKLVRWVLEEIWQNMDALNAHFTTQHFTSIVTEIIPAEGLLTQPLDMMLVTPTIGFDDSR